MNGQRVDRDSRSSHQFGAGVGESALVPKIRHKRPTAMSVRVSDSVQQEELLMLVLVAGPDLDYCARVGESLRRASHQVVLAADFEACRRFAEQASMDAVIMSAASVDAVPLDLVRSVRAHSDAPVMVLVDDASLVHADYVEAGAECATRPADLGELTRWVEASASR